MRMTRARLALLFALEAAGVAFFAFALLDVRARRAEALTGVNQWGFRGAAHVERNPHEVRVALVGGSAAFQVSIEPGVVHEGTLADEILYQLREDTVRSGRYYDAVNLSEPRVSADSYVDALRRYQFLGLDVICVFDGYDTLGGLPPHARERSTVFRAVGYLPTLPARLLQRPGWMSDADLGLAEILRDDRTAPADVSCTGASRAYCAAMPYTVR